MGKYILKRVLTVIPVLFAILTMVFFLMRALPGNPILSRIAADAENEEYTQEEIDFQLARYGLDGSVWHQYVNYLAGIFKGDWGISYFNDVPVFDNILSKMMPTIQITLYSTVITVVFGIALGMICATHRNSWLDYILSTGSMVTSTIPTFCVGILLLYVFAFKLRIFPLTGYKTIEKVGFWKSMWSLTLPSFAIGLSGMAGYARHTRSQMLDVLGADYIRTAKAKGLKDFAVNYKHAFKNTLAFMITMVSGTITGHLGGSTVIENVFGIPGVGKLAYESLTRRDYSQEQAILVFFSLIFVVMNIVLDVIYKLLDPRIELD